MSAHGGLDLDATTRELDGSPYLSPYSEELARSVISDCWRRAGLAPVDDKDWPAIKKKGGRHFKDQLSVLAHTLLSSGLRGAVVAALEENGMAQRVALDRFFEAIEPLTAEMMRSNLIRREEFLRRFVDCVGGRIAGEKGRTSKKRLDELDYRKALSEYARAEAARRAEAKKRAKLLEEARQREAAARGWRE
jgi:hypothetical protein